MKKAILSSGELKLTIEAGTGTTPETKITGAYDPAFFEDLKAAAGGSTMEYPEALYHKMLLQLGKKMKKEEFDEKIDELEKAGMINKKMVGEKLLIVFS